MSIFDDDEEILEPDEDMDADDMLLDWENRIAEARRQAINALLYDKEC